MGKTGKDEWATQASSYRMNKPQDERYSTGNIGIPIGYRYSIGNMVWFWHGDGQELHL